MKACPEQHRLYSTKYLLKYLRMNEFLLIFKKYNVNTARFFFFYTNRIATRTSRKPLVWTFCRDDIYFAVCKKNMSKGRPSVKSNVWSKWPELGGKKRVKSHEIEKMLLYNFCYQAQAIHPWEPYTKIKNLLSIISAFIKYN